jgi:ketosteroid isomerase-like protein
VVEDNPIYAACVREINGARLAVTGPFTVRDVGVIVVAPNDQWTYLANIDGTAEEVVYEAAIGAGLLDGLGDAPALLTQGERRRRPDRRPSHRGAAPGRREATCRRVSADVGFRLRGCNMATGETFNGPEGVKQYLLVWATAFPDSQVETTEIIAGDRGAVVEFTGRGTQSGPLQTPTGDIPPTGRAAEQRFCTVNRIENGKITEARQYFDLLGLMQQLGLVPEPEPKAKQV